MAGLACPPMETAPPSFELAEHLEQITGRIGTQGNEAKELGETIERVRKVLLRVICGLDSLPRDLNTLSYTPAVFQKFRKLEKGWDGYRSEPLSADLIDKAEVVWTLLSALLPPADRPNVHAGAEDFITFSWKRDMPRKELDMAIYKEEDGSFTYDWLLRFDGEMGTYEGEFDLNTLIAVAQSYSRL